MIKKLVSFLLCISVFTGIFTLTASAYEPTGFDLKAKNALLVCLDTDEVLYEKGADEQVYPASITKIMTIILALESERYNPDAKIAMSKEALDLILGTGSVVSNLKEGEEITQLDLMHLLLMSSCGDCAYLVALYYGGSVDGFIQMMNDKAKELGMKGTHYTNPVGLHDEQNYTTANDTYILTRYALQNDTFKDICEKTRYTVGATNMSPARTISTTVFLQDSSTAFYYTYAKGVKTGFTDESGRCLVSTASYNGYNYMCLVFGCENSKTYRYEFGDSKNLYRWAFNNFEYKKIADTNNPICEIGVDLSLETDFVSLYVEEGFLSVLPKDADDSTITINPKLKAESVDAPIKKGDVLGTAEIVYAEKVIGTVNLVSGENVKKSNLLAAVRAVKNFFTSVYMQLVYIAIGIAVVIFIIAIIRMNSGRKAKRKVKYIPYNERENNDD